MTADTKTQTTKLTPSQLALLALKLALDIATHKIDASTDGAEKIIDLVYRGVTDDE